VDRECRRFLKILIVGIAAIVAVIVFGTIVQNTTGFPLPQGVCIAILLLFVLVTLFLGSQRAATNHNFIVDDA
jgi:hypothetical protein